MLDTSMFKLSTLSLAGTVLLVAIMLGAPGHASAQTTKKLTYATYIPNTLVMAKVDTWFMDEVTKRTNGRITFERYYSGTLLKASDVLPGTAAGATDIGNSVPSAYNRRDYPLSNITLPFISSHVDSVGKAFKELYEANDEFREEYESKGVKLLYAPAYGENTIWSTKPIRKPEDVDGLKVRAVLAIGDALSKLGASAVAIPWPDAIEGMKRGVVDAMSAAPFDTAVSAGLSEVAGYGSDVGRMGVYAVSATVINLNTWNSLDAETQRVMEEVAAEALDHYLGLLNKTVDELAVKVADRVKAGELEVAQFSEEDVKSMRNKIGQEVWAEWIATANKAGADGQKLLDHYKKLTSEFDETSKYTPGIKRVKALLD
jgi:TRAP-type C4-dicarboxylate transport system substrate-binding protein